MHPHDFTREYLNSWEPEPIHRTGIHEAIAIELAAEVEKLIPCYIEGPEKPEDGWANVHIDGLGNESVTISIWSDRIILAQFNNSLGSRKMRSDWAYNCTGRRLERPLHEPDCIEWTLKFAFKMILEWGTCLYNCYDRDEKIRRLNIKSKYTPATMLLGRPYYLI